MASLIEASDTKRKMFFELAGLHRARARECQRLAPAPIVHAEDDQALAVGYGQTRSENAAVGVGLIGQSSRVVDGPAYVDLRDEVSAGNPLVLAGSTTLVMVVALGATPPSARRAARTNPATSLLR